MEAVEVARPHPVNPFGRQMLLVVLTITLVVPLHDTT
jgi:hypothetical protein